MGTSGINTKFKKLQLLTIVPAMHIGDLIDRANHKILVICLHINVFLSQEHIYMKETCKKYNECVLNEPDG